ncbi:MAG: hypothetical protein R3Y63_03320 [Eubacteriales bacterium]
MEYLIMDEDHSSLTQGVLRSGGSSPILEFEIPENDVPRLDGHVNLQFLSFDEGYPSFEGKVTRRRGNRMAVEKGSSLGEAPLENLRVPFDHDTYVYPVSGTWQGRVTVKTDTLSCGALSFFSPRPFTGQELVEVAVHIREGALLVRGKIINQKEEASGQYYCVTKFMSGVDDIERMIRREVLYLQLKERDDLKDGKVTKKLFMIS